MCSSIILRSALVFRIKSEIVCLDGSKQKDRGGVPRVYVSVRSMIAEDMFESLAATETAVRCVSETLEADV